MSEIKLSTKPYKGTRDFYPRDMALRNWFFGKIREALTLSCFEEYGGPMLESLDLYIAKSGEELAGEQTYNFEDKGHRRLAIRPEMTPTVARMVAAKTGELNFPLRWFSIPNMYRCENPQRGRLREFWQLNVDIFGCDTYEADLETIISAIRVLRIFGADSSMFTVHINNRRFFNDVVSKIADTDIEGCRKISKIIDKRKKIPHEIYVQELEKLGMTEPQIEQLDSLYTSSVEEATAICPDSVGSMELVNLFEMLKKIGLSEFCCFDFGIIRGLDYYTGTVFEVFDNAPENNRAMFGGGRYDNLVGLFVNNSKISGVGYGMGDVTLQNFLETHALIPSELTEKKVLITRFDDVPYEAYVELSDKLYESGLSASIYLGTKKFGKQIDYAVKENYTHIVIMGGSEHEAGIVKIKNLAAHEEKSVPIAELSNSETFA